HRLLRRPQANEGNGRVDHRRRLGGPLQPDGDLPALERAAAPDSEKGGRLAVPDYLPRRVIPTRPHDPAARMRGGAAQVQAADGRAVARPSGERAQEEELRQRHRALENVAAREPETALQVERREDLPIDHGALEVRG